MPGRLAVIGLLSALLTGCGSGDACDRPLPYQSSSEGSELVVPEGLTPPPKSQRKSIPPVADERRERSNPCSVGPPELKIESRPAKVLDDGTSLAERSPPSSATPLKIAPGFDSESVEDTVAAWVKSWSAGDSPAYLSFYAQDFTSTDETLNREQWMQRRQQLVNDTGPAAISVREVTVDDLPAGRKLVRLIQDFTSSEGDEASVVKLLEMVREGEGWRIRREQVVKVLAN